jgi:hypothetical protein
LTKIAEHKNTSIKIRIIAAQTAFDNEKLTRFLAEIMINSDRRNFNEVWDCEAALDAYLKINPSKKGLHRLGVMIGRLLSQKSISEAAEILNDTFKHQINETAFLEGIHSTGNLLTQIAKDNNQNNDIRIFAALTALSKEQSTHLFAELSWANDTALKTYLKADPSKKGLHRLGAIVGEHLNQEPLYRAESILTKRFADQLKLSDFLEGIQSTSDLLTSIAKTEYLESDLRLLAGEFIYNGNPPQSFLAELSLNSKVALRKYLELNPGQDGLQYLGNVLGDYMRKKPTEEVADQLLRIYKNVTDESFMDGLHAKGSIAYKSHVDNVRHIIDEESCTDNVCNHTDTQEHSDLYESHTI